MRLILKISTIIFSFWVGVIGVSFGATAAVEVDSDGSTIALSASTPSEAFRDRRKVGVTASLLGLQGLIGAGLGVHITPTHQISANFGLGAGFQSFSLRYRYFFGGTWFSPYISSALTRWYTVGDSEGPIRDSNPTFLRSKFLNRGEIERGEFSLTFLSPGLGLQYNQLKGDFRGLALFAEIMLLARVPQVISEPLAEVGMAYFF